MSFPSILYGTEGEQFSVYSEKRFPYGQMMVLPDGRRFRFAEIGGTAVATARLCQAEVPGANFDELAVAVAAAAQDTDIEITNGATTIADGDFDEGFLNIEDDSGEGHLYKIKNHDPEGAGSAQFTVNIERGKFQDDPSASDPNSKHGIVVALTTSTTVGISKHPFKDVIIHPSPNTAALVGVTPRALGANKFGWLQVGGPASVLGDGTLAIGDSVMASDAVDGAVEDWILTEGTPNVEITPAVGQCAEVAADTEESLIILAVPGW